MLSFNTSFGSNMILQGAPKRACLYGTYQDETNIRVTMTTSTTIEAETRDGQFWNACLDPVESSLEKTYNITVMSDSSNVTIVNVRFGDVWYCGGQSNMALPMIHTISRNRTVQSIVNESKYRNIHIHGIAGNMNPGQSWISALDAASNCFDSPDSCALFQYSSTCWYYAQSLSEYVTDRPIGMIHTSFGGSTIEQWLDNATISKCRNATIDASNGEWHESRVLPYLGMSLKGWIWYQGENDMHGVFGNSALGYGYGCLMSELVKSWRSIWNQGTDNPFGIVTLASSGNEGGRDMGAMRWSQFGNYGVLPNKALPNTFGAQAFDLDDPWMNTTCYDAGCCPNNYKPKGTCDGCLGPNQYCANLSATNYYMGPIHPRDKLPVGARLARAAWSQVYDGDKISTGPTVSGCNVDGSSIVIRFDLNDGDRVSVRDYASKGLPSKFEILTNASLFCIQTTGDGTTCIDDGTGHGIPYSASFDTAWQSVDVRSRDDTSVEVFNLDVSKVVAVRYAWQGACCDDRPATSEPCPVASCPINGVVFPAHPFLARITDSGKCECIAPQVCDG